MIDPIDGTKNFVRGVPVWATLIALVVDDEPVLGVASAPMLQRRWWAAAGGGAWTGRSLLKATQCQVSDVRRLEDASFSYSSIRGWEDRGLGEDMLALMRRVWRTRAYGDFWSYMLLAEGAVDIAAEPELAVHDMAALDVIVREAGGRFTGLDGVPGPMAATRSRATGACTTRPWRSWATSPTTTATRTRPPATSATSACAAAPAPSTSSVRVGDPPPTPSPRPNRRTDRRRAATRTTSSKRWRCATEARGL